MSTETLIPEEPEAPTNRPPSMRRVKLWLQRPYARKILILNVVIGFLLLPLAWLLLAGMNQTGAPASEIMKDIESRIAELFQERLKNDKQVVGLTEIEEVYYHTTDNLFNDELDLKHFIKHREILNLLMAICNKGKETLLLQESLLVKYA